MACGFHDIPESPGCSAAQGLAEEEAQVEGADVNEQAFENVVLMFEVGSPHGAGLVAVGEGAFDDFASSFSMGDAFVAFDALPVFVNDVLLGRFVFPFSAAAVGFADAGRQAVVFVQGAQGVVGVVAFVGDDFAKGLELISALGFFGHVAQIVFGLVERFVNRRRVALVRALQSYSTVL